MLKKRELRAEPAPKEKKRFKRDCMNVPTFNGQTTLYFTRDPEISEIKDLHICDATLLETAFILLTGYSPHLVSILEIYAAFRYLRGKYTHYGSVFILSTLHTMLFDFHRAGIVEMQWVLGNEPRFRITEEHRWNILSEFYETHTTEETIRAYVKKATLRARIPADMLAQIFIFQTEFLQSMEMSQEDKEEVKQTLREYGKYDFHLVRSMKDGLSMILQNESEEQETNGFEAVRLPSESELSTSSESESESESEKERKDDDDDGVRWAWESPYFSAEPESSFESSDEEKKAEELEEVQQMRNELRGIRKEIIMDYPHEDTKDRGTKYINPGSRSIRWNPRRHRIVEHPKGDTKQSSPPRDW